MASSEDRDKDNASHDKQSKPNNPFIQFRQFADTQISSLLQGIIGLPSAFSKRPPDDPRWAGIDDGLRRRDELQARQKELKESEARKLHPETSDNEAQPAAWTAVGTNFPSREYQPLGRREHKYGTSSKDLLLYSPVTKSLFAHLQQQDFDEADWNDLKTPTTWGDKGFLLSCFPYKLRNDQLSPQLDQDDMLVTHFFLYNELNSASRLRSEYSLLPYLIFSPYSPLRLDSAEPGEDHFPYCEAFEDLVATNQTTRSPWQHVVFSMMGSRVTSPEGKMQWIEKLYNLGYLQEKETKVIGEAYSKGPEDHSRLTVFDQLRLVEAARQDIRSATTPDGVSRERSTVPWTSREDTEGRFEAVRNPRTEQEMYDHFLNWASSPQAVKDVVQAGEEFLSSLENDGILGRRKEQYDGTPGPPSLMREILEVAKAIRQMSQSQDIARDPKVAQEDRPSQNDSPSWQAKLSESSDRVVSSSTTTEQTVHEDGSVETSVTVRKRFSNGRETSTTTHHCEEPVMVGLKTAEQLRNEAKELENAKKDSDEGKKKQPPGWFWN
ncbi:hypothetical protein BKA65DRAFT_511546 [Rhexocercosporidium sp. MPI-PUGE-AT-0058]|nr:hypothetical protein BKA65DRAFT_511546 [Rhexocercosporidium sp. MPI-PUGE-AT-0058]